MKLLGTRGYHILRWTPPDSPRRILFLPNHAGRHPKPETLSARSAPSPGVAAQRRPLFPSSCPGCPPAWTRHVAAAAAAAHHPLKTVPHLFHHSKPATARTTAVTVQILHPAPKIPLSSSQNQQISSHTRRPRSRSTLRAPSRSRSSSQGPGAVPKTVAWQRGPPASLLSSHPQVREMAKENSALKAQISAQQSQIAKLTTYIQSLEAKIDRALAAHTQTATPTSSQTQEPHCRPHATSNMASAPAQQPQSTNKRKATTPTASLHAEVDIARTVTAAVKAAISTLKSELTSELETRFNTIHQIFLETANSFTVLKSSTEAALDNFNVQLAAQRKPSASRQPPATLSTAT
ncbi:hypothetical protein HPB50_023756 [Hyalomma asiaticum]|uniref:Uncharacterized protein n=1 Tax=Hyalomma asiaticum TaxID=266040 RepID=A0ACB7S322_HYAAI|nr:hypothetical protein HPB50_023756 [Hyalomma asiaticum]